MPEDKNSSQMDPPELNPVTPFEEDLAKAISGKIGLDEFKATFLRTLLYIPDCAPFTDNETINKPLIIDTPHGEMVAIFSSKYRLDKFQKQIKWVTAFTGNLIVQIIPEGKGLILNPHSTYCFQVGSKEIEKWQRTL